jgi:hypothetical protein
MTDEQRRVALLLLGCIPVRSGAAALAKNIDAEKLPYLGLVALLPAIGFLSIYLGGHRKTGPETMGAPIWWNDLRPVHGALYGLFAYMAINKHPKSWVVLIIDLVVGLLAFTHFHSKNQ